jgi:hypothetical protein
MILARCVRTLVPWLRLLAVLPLLVGGGIAAAPQPASAGLFIAVQGSHLVYNGQPVRLKGVSFYPQSRPWAPMWTDWHGPQTRADLQHLADVGGNSIRVLLPYRRQHGVFDDTGAINPVFIDRVRQMVQMAGEQQLKVLFTLFDFYDDTPAADDPAWQANLAYLDALAGAFADDDRVLGWDLHNEPDLYGSWTARPDAALDWMLRVAAELHERAPRQLVTVGVAHPDALWQADGQGRILLDAVDFVSFHSYDAGAVAHEIADVRAHTPKPVVLQETGWPTGPCGMDPNFNEAHQVILYRAMVQAASAGDLDGLFAWTLWDFPSTTSSGGGVESEQDFFGLLRLDGSLKPGALIFRDGFQDGSVPLASTTTSALPLTIAPPRPPTPLPPGWIPPIYFPETGHDIRDEFRDYWKRFGGLLIFGYPITQPRMENGRKVQYFERARFEYHAENGLLPGFKELDQAGRLRLVVQLTRYGAPLAAARQFPAGTPPGTPDIAWFPETQHTLRGVFKRFWEEHAGLTNFGYPLSEEVQEVSVLDNRPYTVQYFERARLEYHPEHAGTPFEVLLGQLGTEDMRARGCR